MDYGEKSSCRGHRGKSPIWYVPGAAGELTASSGYAVSVNSGGTIFAIGSPGLDYKSVPRLTTGFQFITDCGSVTAVTKRNNVQQHVIFLKNNGDNILRIGLYSLGSEALISPRQRDSRELALFGYLVAATQLSISGSPYIAALFNDGQLRILPFDFGSVGWTPLASHSLSSSGPGFVYTFLAQQYATFILVCSGSVTRILGVSGSSLTQFSLYSGGSTVTISESIKDSWAFDVSSTTFLVMHSSSFLRLLQYDSVNGIFTILSSTSSSASACSMSNAGLAAFYIGCIVSGGLEVFAMSIPSGTLRTVATTGNIGANGGIACFSSKRSLICALSTGSDVQGFELGKKDVFTKRFAKPFSEVQHLRAATIRGRTCLIISRGGGSSSYDNYIFGWDLETKTISRIQTITLTDYGAVKSFFLEGTQNWVALETTYSKGHTDARIGAKGSLGGQGSPAQARPSR